jgi:CDP-diacylglycerol--glycerol-3-phosphate 3-phosphatidyltransferase
MDKTADSSITTKKTFTDYLRLWFKWVLDPLGRFFLSLGLTPNSVTALGLIGNTIGAYYLARGELFIGGIIIAVMTPVDALDGTMARLRGDASDWGAFVDSVSDRYSELIIYGGLLYYFLTAGDLWGGMLTFGATAGSILVSYVRARAESLGYEAKVGLLTRAERYLVLTPALLFDQLYLGLGLLAFFANLTAVQRIWHVRRHAHARTKK